MDKFEVPPDWVKIKTDHCVACGVGKYDKDKGECVVYHKLVNGTRHQYIAFEPPTKPLNRWSMKKILQVVRCKSLEDGEVIQDYFEIRTWSLNGEMRNENIKLGREHMSILKEEMKDLIVWKPKKKK